MLITPTLFLAAVLAVVAARPDGSACRRNRNCRKGSYCAAGTCKTLPAFGEPCGAAKLGLSRECSGLSTCNYDPESGKQRGCCGTTQCGGGTPECAPMNVPLKTSCPCALEHRNYLHDDQGCEIACYCKAERLPAHKMSQERFSQVIEAISKMKVTPSPWQASASGVLRADVSGLTWWDTLVAVHASALPTNFFAHRNPAFAGWHRVFLMVLEYGMNEVMGYPQPPISIPYWDWTNSEATSFLFTAGALGGDGNYMNGSCISDGPFKDWTFAVNGVGMSVPGPCIYRKLGAEDLPPSTASVQAVLQVKVFASAPWGDTQPAARSFSNFMEGWRVASPYQGVQLHNLVHVYVGGSMTPLSSPNDPVFFFHHCNVDRLYESWLAATSKYSPDAAYPLRHKKLTGLPEGMKVQYVELPVGTGFVVNDGSVDDLEIFWNTAFAPQSKPAEFGLQLAGLWLSLESTAPKDYRNVFQNDEGLVYEGFQLGVTESDYDLFIHQQPEGVIQIMWNAQAVAQLGTPFSLWSPAGFDHQNGTRALLTSSGQAVTLDGFTTTHKNTREWLDDLVAHGRSVANINGTYANPATISLTAEQLKALAIIETQAPPSSGANLLNTRVLKIMSYEVLKAGDEGAEFLETSGIVDVNGQPATEIIVVNLGTDAQVSFQGSELTYFDICTTLYTLEGAPYEAATSACAFADRPASLFYANLYVGADPSEAQPYTYQGMEGRIWDVTDKVLVGGAGPGQNADDYAGLFTDLAVAESIEKQHMPSGRYDQLYSSNAESMMASGSFGNVDTTLP